MGYKDQAVILTEKVQFPQFKANLKGHRAQIAKQRAQVIFDHAAAIYSRTLFSRKERNDQGEPIFDLHQAKIFLRADVKARIHIGKTPAEFQRTRKEYQEFNADIFKHRIYQEMKYVKFCNHIEIPRSKGKF